VLLRAAKAATVAAEFCAHPRNLPRYLSLLRSTPLDVGLPWIMFGAIDFLDKWLKGRSTGFLNTGQVARLCFWPGGAVSW
jgi:hypothetical protein